MSNNSDWNKVSVILCCLVLIFLTSCSFEKKDQKKAIPSLPVMKIAKSSIPVYLEYIGITKSIDSVDIRARVRGFLIKKNFIEGNDVKKGQLLYVIDPKPFEAQLAHAKAQLDESIASQNYQYAEYLRMKQLVDKGNVSKSRFDLTNAKYEQAKAQVALNQAQVEQANINLSYCYMYSPIDGRVGNKHIDVGNLVGGASETLLTNVVKLDPIYVIFNPSVSDFPQILKYQTDNPFKVDATFPNSKALALHGAIDFVDNQASVNTSTVMMRAKVKNPDSLFIPGIYLNVRLILSDSQDVILIPSKAIMELQGKQSVFLVNQKNIVEQRNIKVSGQYKTGSIINSGLKIGEMIIIEGLQKIRPGQIVNPKLADKEN
jgi:RND family efflux transporter MFP subunit